MKERTKVKKGNTAEGIGDAWTFVAFERNTKLVLAWHLGRRTVEDTIAFTEKLAHATMGNFQITTDGFTPYRDAVAYSLGAQHVDFAQVIKIYAAPDEHDTRYSPSVCIGCEKHQVFGNPDMKRATTSHVERQNLNLRMGMRRFTRLTNGFSKRWEKLRAMEALYFAYYNFCRVHGSIRVTPAMEAGLTDHIWTLKELISA